MQHEPQRGGSSSPTDRAEPTPQTLAKSGWALTATRIEIGPAERAAGCERAHALAAAGADVWAAWRHIDSKEHASVRWLKSISTACKSHSAAERCATR